MRKVLAGCLALIFLFSGIPVFAENTGKDTVSIQESMVSVEGETVGSLSENLRFLADMLEDEEIRSLLKIEDVGEIFTEVIWKVMIWLYENRPVTMKILAELGVGERDRRCIGLIWDSMERIIREIQVFADSEEGQRLQKDAAELAADPDFRNSVQQIIEVITSDEVSELVENLTEAAVSIGETEEEENGPLTGEALGRRITQSSFTGKMMLAILSLLEKNDWGKISLAQFLTNEKFWRFALDLASMNSSLDGVLEEELTKISGDPEVVTFLQVNTSGLLDLIATITSRSESGEADGETAGKPDSAGEEAAP